MSLSDISVEAEDVHQPIAWSRDNIVATTGSVLGVVELSMVEDSGVKSANASLFAHNEMVTSISFGRGTSDSDEALITGCADGTARVYLMINPSTSSINRPSILTAPLQVFCGHDQQVTSVAVDLMLDIAITASEKKVSFSLRFAREITRALSPSILIS